MTTYSHSRLGTFQQCRYKYKLQYIDKIKVELESIEAFMGKRVHETLEKLYKDLKFQKLNSNEELKEQLVMYAQQKDVEVVFGTEKKASVKEYTSVVYPEDKEELIALIKKKGLYEEFSMINYPRLSPKIIKGEVDKDVIKMVKKEKEYRVSVSGRKALKDK